MLQNWPAWPQVDNRFTLSAEKMAELKQRKSKVWDLAQVGFNISSKISKADVANLQSMGVKSVRIGSVGIGKEIGYDLCDFLTHPEEQLAKLEATVNMLADHGITTLLTLDRRLVSVETWSLIAACFCGNPSLVGYDLINEPFSKELETEIHWLEFQSKRDTETGTWFSKYYEPSFLFLLI
jgi:hypothetical protein